MVPDDYLGNVIGDLNSRRGQIQGQENRTGATQVDSLVPLANMFGYATVGLHPDLDVAVLALAAGLAGVLGVLLHLLGGPAARPAPCCWSPS